MSTCLPTVVGGMVFLSSLFSHIPFSGATVQCFNCRGDECGTGGGHLETCVRYDDVCATWIYRKGIPEKGIEAGDVFKRGCIFLMVATKGCQPEGNYNRCACTTSGCNDEDFGVSTTTGTPIILSNDNLETSEIVTEAPSTTILPTTTEATTTEMPEGTTEIATEVEDFIDTTTVEITTVEDIVESTTVVISTTEVDIISTEKATEEPTTTTTTTKLRTTKVPTTQPTTTVAPRRSRKGNRKKLGDKNWDPHPGVQKLTQMSRRRKNQMPG